MKILAIAYGYSGEDVSESYSSYQLVRALRQEHEVTVLTKDKVDDPDAVHLAVTPRLASSPYYRALKLDYFAFMARAYAYAKPIAGNFDLIHHISPISLRYPNLLCNLGKPFVWGAVGGSIPYPPGFAAVEKREPWIYKLKGLDRMRLSADPLMVNTLARASAIVTTSAAALALLPSRHRHKASVIPEGFAAEALPVPGANEGNYLFSSGRMVPYKGMEYLVRAFAQCPEANNLQLKITGDGPELNRLRQLVADLGLAERVTLLGKVTRDTNLALMAGSLACVFPALNEAFGHVNLEAMAAGRPIIVTDWGGPADIVEHGVSGFKVKPANPDQFVQELSRHIGFLVANGDLRQRLGEGARMRVREVFSWEAAARRYGAVYRRALGGEAMTA